MQGCNFVRLSPRQKNPIPSAIKGILQFLLCIKDSLYITNENSQRMSLERKFFAYSICILLIGVSMSFLDTTTATRSNLGLCGDNAFHLYSDSTVFDAARVRDLVSSGNFEEANSIMDKALISEPDNAGLLIIKSLISACSGETKQASVYADKALALAPNNTGIMNIKGTSILVSAFVDANTLFDRVLAIEPNNVDALRNKGALLFTLEKYPDAITFFDKILTIEPNDSETLKYKNLALQLSNNSTRTGNVTN
jgi:tetratricopeptide (TPR) repeat protein